MIADSDSCAPADAIEGPLVHPLAVSPSVPSTSPDSTPRSHEATSRSPALTHLVSMSRAAVAKLPRVPRVSVDEALFVNSRRSCQE